MQCVLYMQTWNIYLQAKDGAAALASGAQFNLPPAILPAGEHATVGDQLQSQALQHRCPYRGCLPGPVRPCANSLYALGCPCGKADDSRIATASVAATLCTTADLFSWVCTVGVLQPTYAQLVAFMALISFSGFIAITPLRKVGALPALRPYTIHACQACCHIIEI